MDTLRWLTSQDYSSILNYIYRNDEQFSVVFVYRKHFPILFLIIFIKSN